MPRILKHLSCTVHFPCTCFYLHSVYKPKISRITFSPRAIYVTKREWAFLRAHFSHERTIIDTSTMSPALSFILTILSTDFSTVALERERRKANEKRRSKRKKSQRLDPFSPIADVKTHSRPWLSVFFSIMHGEVLR